MFLSRCVVGLLVVFFVWKYLIMFVIEWCFVIVIIVGNGMFCLLVLVMNFDWRLCVLKFFFSLVSVVCCLMIVVMEFGSRVGFIWFFYSC